MPWKTSLCRQINELTDDPANVLRYLPVKGAKSPAPLLFIGLGGTGLRIGKRVREMMIECFEPAENPRYGMEQLPPYTRFLGIDTDSNSLKALGYQPDECCEIDVPNIASELKPENRENLPEYITSWLNPCCAPGERQAGRLQLFFSISDVARKLHNALEPFCYVQNPIQVFIASSTVGATGSAIFLDVAYLLRYVAKELHLDRRLSITALLTMPDAHEYITRGPHAAYLYARGYASLRELDYWMDQYNRRNSFEQQYAHNFTVKWDGPPFDDCILLGKNISDASDSAAILTDTLPDIVAAYITSIFAHEPSDLFPDDYGFYLRYRSVVRANLAPQPMKFDVTRRYTVIGASNGQIPLQDMILTEAVFMFNKLKEYYDVLKTPDLYAGNEYTDFVQRIVGNCATELLAPINIKSPRDVAITQIRNSDHLA
ncbi:MAG: hypothetical protein IKK75_11555, partial [Clostridia bacterium]|nr:hypothetical protein [Clostridia bacterium]